jgi:hypothetical protein
LCWRLRVCGLIPLERLPRGAVRRYGCGDAGCVVRLWVRCGAGCVPLRGRPRDGTIYCPAPGDVLTPFCSTARPKIMLECPGTTPSTSRPLPAVHGSPQLVRTARQQPKTPKCRRRRGIEVGHGMRRRSKKNAVATATAAIVRTTPDSANCIGQYCDAGTMSAERSSVPP